MRYVANNFMIDSIKDKTRPPVKSICELVMKLLFFALAVYQDLIPHHGWLDKKAMVQLANPVPDQDIEITRGPGHPDPKIRGGGRGACLPKELNGSSLGLSLVQKLGGGGGGPLPWIRHCNQVEGKIQKALLVIH